MNVREELQIMADSSKDRISSEAREVMSSFQKELESKKLLSTLRKAGDKFPNFSLPNHRGGLIKSEDLLQKGSLIVTFYRGGWCPYCNIELRGYQAILPQIQEKKAQLVAISPELADNSLELVQKHGLDFLVLSDLDNKFAQELGLVFTLSKELATVYKEFGIDFKKSQGNYSSRLPIPATYVIGQDHTIKFAHYDINYALRCEPSDTLKFL